MTMLCSFRTAAILSLFALACSTPDVPHEVTNVTPIAPSAPTEQKRCFLSVTTSSDGSITDSLSIQLMITGAHVTGRMDWLPGMKDRMRGTLDGTLTNDTLVAMYAYTAEGNMVTEERVIHLGTNYAAVLTGELVERSGIWQLKDRAKAIEGMKVPEVPCR